MRGGGTKRNRTNLIAQTTLRIMCVPNIALIFKRISLNAEHNLSCFVMKVVATKKDAVGAIQLSF